MSAVSAARSRSGASWVSHAGTATRQPPSGPSPHATTTPRSSCTIRSRRHRQRDERSWLRELITMGSPPSSASAVRSYMTARETVSRETQAGPPASGMAAPAWFRPGSAVLTSRDVRASTRRGTDDVDQTTSSNGHSHREGCTRAWSLALHVTAPQWFGRVVPRRIRQSPDALGRQPQLGLNNQCAWGPWSQLTILTSDETGPRATGRCRALVDTTPRFGSGIVADRPVSGPAVDDS